MEKIKKKRGVEREKVMTVIIVVSEKKDIWCFDRGPREKAKRSELVLQIERGSGKN